MLATDLHLGFLENDPIRGDDSFLVFEEILQNARDHKV
jgi:double-strand break repair protein MRE11